MDDSSGHYSAGFFYGNNYWTGSILLCMEIESAEDHTMPPFHPGFFVLKTDLNDTRITAKVSRSYFIV